MPAVLYGALAWRIATLRGGALGLLGALCALVACLGHVRIWSWAHGRRASAEQATPAPPPLVWIAAYFASILVIIVALGR